MNNNTPIGALEDARAPFNEPSTITSTRRVELIIKLYTEIDVEVDNTCTEDFIKEQIEYTINKIYPKEDILDIEQIKIL